MRFATDQHGVICRDQVLAMGGSRHVLRRMRGSGAWEQVSPRVLRAAGAPRTDAQRLMAAVLDAGDGAFLSGPTSLGWWQVPGFGTSERWLPQVTRARGCTRRPTELAHVREVLDVLPHQVTRLGGLPVSVPARAVFELASLARRERVERACDNVLAMRLTTVSTMHRMLDEWADRGRSGTVLMREILEDRPLGYEPPASGLERRFETIVAEACLGPYRRQIDLGGGAWIGRVDFKHERFPLVVEVLGDRYHQSVLDRAADEHRFGELRRAGFTVVSVWDVELWHDPPVAIDRVRAAEAHQRRAA